MGCGHGPLAAVVAVHSLVRNDSFQLWQACSWIPHVKVCTPVQDMDVGAGEAGPVQPPSGEQVVTQRVALPPRVLQLLKEHTAFLHHQGQRSCLHIRKTRSALKTFQNKTPKPQVLISPQLARSPLLHSHCYVQTAHLPVRLLTQGCCPFFCQSMGNTLP